MSDFGYRTVSREKIRAYLEANRDRTVSASDIDAYLRAEGHPVNITSIYRFLERLRADGEVMVYTDASGKKSVYQDAAPDGGCQEHLHLKCTKCGEVIHLERDCMESIAGHIAKDYGFAVQCRNSIIYGLCAKCGM